jgi:hypothetical protein
MRKTIAVIALTLALGVVTAAKTHHHHQAVINGVGGNISDTDAWRHYLLHIAATAVGPPPRHQQVARRFRSDRHHCLEVPR